MAKVEITEWGELALIEEMLSNWQMVHGRYANHYEDCRNLLKRVRPALMEATNNLET